MLLNHRKLARLIARRNGFLVKHGEMLLREYLAEMRARLLAGEKIYFPQICSLEIANMPPRRRFNPRTLQEIWTGNLPKLKINPTTGFLRDMRDTHEARMAASGADGEKEE